MSTTKIIQYIHRPNMTELGMGNTHETYLLVDSKTDMSVVFPLGENVVVEDAKFGRTYILRSAKPSEFRINQMGPIFRDYAVMPGDEVIITHYECDGVIKNNLSVKNYRRVGFSVNGNGTEIVNIERLKDYAKENNVYSLDVIWENNKRNLSVAFLESRKKRSDSPNNTDYYQVLLDGIILPNGKYFLTLGEENILAPQQPKSEYNKVVLEDNYAKNILREDDHANDNKQQIYYGAPGTGKSHEINRLTEGKEVIRTTFHPDSDYASFVGCYKPHMVEEDMTTIIGETLKVVKDVNGKPKRESRIVYKYSCQAFLQAYVAAWLHPEKEHYLVIEEINRGNCAQIFGDIFQLLDRNESGYSCYPIKADADMEQELNILFANDWNIGDELSQEINNKYAKHYPDGITKNIKEGSLLLLPKNLYIWATMNTSDQSLFPIDSAFKRRWDWKYVKITKGRSRETKEEYNWRVKFDYLDDKALCHCSFDWWDFINTINEEIAKTTSSDDKKLGYFFCKPKEQGGDFIDAETFVGKVVFYLWNDVYKDESSELFKVAEGQEPSFDLFYKEKEEEGEWKVVVDTNCLKSFVDNVFKKQPDKVIVEAEHQETEEKQESSVE